MSQRESGSAGFGEADPGPQSSVYREEHEEIERESRQVGELREALTRPVESPQAGVARMVTQHPRGTREQVRGRETRANERDRISLEEATAERRVSRARDML